MIFFLVTPFLPEAVSEDKYGGRDAPLFGYMEIPSTTTTTTAAIPNPSQRVKRATVVQILYLSYY